MAADAATQRWLRLGALFALLAAAAGVPLGNPLDVRDVQGGNGKNGTQVTTDTGDTFTYVNNFGGSWSFDPANPFQSSGKAQEWTPSLTEEWKYGKDIIRGVNLGGWLVTEPFIIPSLFENYQGRTPKPIDEWTLSEAMGGELAQAMEEHYRTFITEKDFAEIAAAGLNWVRIPLGFWAVETHEGEPYLAKVSWTYFTKAISWARKYGIRILLDFHALPGSQNQWNHSGREKHMNWMVGAMGIANAERSLEHMRSLVEYISQPGVKEVVPMIGIVNEVPAWEIGEDVLGSFFYQAQTMLRNITGSGAGNGPIIVMHDAFAGLRKWKGFLSGADRLAIDRHPYLAFDPPNQRPYSEQTPKACEWGGEFNETQQDWGIAFGGEWSAAINDCGYSLEGFTNEYEKQFGAGSCEKFNDWRKWDDNYKKEVREFALAQMDALQNWFFWTWKIGKSNKLDYPINPQWNYQLGVKEGWIPADPRAAGGYCKAKGACKDCPNFDGNHPGSAIGAVPTQNIAQDQVQKYGQWPPASMKPDWVAPLSAQLPRYTQTGTPVTLPVPTGAGAGGLHGWAFPTDTAGAYVPIQGCQYPDAYDATKSSALPTGCGGAAGGSSAPAPTPTPTPSPTSSLGAANATSTASPSVNAQKDAAQDTNAQKDANATAQKDADAQKDTAQPKDANPQPPPAASKDASNPASEVKDETKSDTKDAAGGAQVTTSAKAVFPPAEQPSIEPQV